MEKNKELVIASPSTRENFILKRVYLLMFSALLITSLVAFLVSRSERLTAIFSANFIALIVIAVLEVVFVVVLSSKIKRLSVTSALLLFYLYSIVNGLLFASIFYIYAGNNTIFLAFLCSGITFGIASLYGAITKKNISGWGRWLLLALFSIIVVSLINFFFNSNPLEYVICIVGIVVFSLLSAWDSNKIVNVSRGLGIEVREEDCTKIAVLGALDLYLDFINILLYFIRLLGLSRSNND